uniref:Glycosyl transferase family 4 n=1 Tax=Ammonifex degensii TaxID=42838 RepID=A0A7C2IDU5_9THEO
MQNSLPLLFALLLGFLVVRGGCKPFLNLLRKAGAIRPNYRGQEIPVGGGVLFFFALLVGVPGVYLFPPASLEGQRIVGFLFLTALTTLVGLLDDAWGSRRASGFKGHFGRLFRGELTTGALKAMATMAGSLILFLPGSAVGEGVLNAVLVALWVNTLNLFDLRPGRAGKVFLVTAVVLTAAAWRSPELYLLWVVGGALCAFLPFDLRGKAMMGDAGANTLGAVIGATIAWTLGTEARLGILFGLLTLHILTERYSLTEIISRNRVLNSLDRLGRMKDEE